MGAPLPASGLAGLSRIGVASHRGGDRRLGGRRNAAVVRRGSRVRPRTRSNAGSAAKPAAAVGRTAERSGDGDRTLRRGRSTAARGGSGGKGFARRAGARAVGHLVVFGAVGPNVRRGTLPTAFTAPRQILNRTVAADGSPWTRRELGELASRHGKRRGYWDRWPTSDADGNRRTSRIENASRPRLISAAPSGDDRQRVTEQAELGPPRGHPGTATSTAAHPTIVSTEKNWTRRRTLSATPRRSRGVSRMLSMASSTRSIRTRASSIR